jgi:Ras-related protein Rap-1B
MKTGQGFLLVFSITSLTSLHELHALRDQIMRIKDSESVPIVLVGNKSDLEDDRAVTRARAFQVSQSWGRVPYYETSARRRANVDEVFKDLCRQIIRKDMEAQAGTGASSSGGGKTVGFQDGSGRRERRRDGSSGGKGRRRRDKRKKGESGSSCTIL